MRELSPSGHGRARGLVSSRTSGARVGARQFEPPPELRDVVECFWTGTWDLVGQEPHVTELLGDPCVHLVAERDELAGRSESRVVGVWTRRWVRRLEGRGFVRGVKLRAGAARALFDFEAAALTDRITPLAALFDNAAELESILLRDDEEAAFRAAGAWLVRQRRSPDPDVGLAVLAAARVRQHLTVESLAADVGLGVRALQRLFREHVGAPPKLLVRRHRLQEAALRIERGEAPNLARLAAELGYADQAHFSRDLRRATGLTARELAARVR